MFNIRSDPGETNDLALINPGLLTQLRARFFEVNATQWNVPVCPKDPEACQAYVAANDGFFGPYLVLAMKVYGSLHASFLGSTYLNL